MAGNKKNGLGRGLDSMIPAGGSTGLNEENGQPTKVKISLVEPNHDQPRKNFKEDALEELTESIRQYGIIAPLLVVKRDGHYMIVAGERRWRAALKVGLKEVPVIIGEYTDQEIAEISLIENLQREDLDPIEEALAYKRLLTEFNMKQEEVAQRVSKNRTTITNSIRLLKLCPEVQQMIIDKQITTGHARALLAIDDANKQYVLALKAFNENLSVREVEKLVKNADKPVKTKKEPDKEMELFYQSASDKLKSALGTKVTINAKGDGKGKVEIEFYSNDDLDRIMAILK